MRRGQRCFWIAYVHELMLFSWFLRSLELLFFFEVNRILLNVNDPCYSCFVSACLLYCSFLCSCTLQLDSLVGFFHLTLHQLRLFMIVLCFQLKGQHIYVKCCIVGQRPAPVLILMFILYIYSHRCPFFRQIKTGDMF